MTITSGSDALASDFISTSSGSGDSGKVPKLDANGQLDLTFTKEIAVRLYGDGSDGSAVLDGTNTFSWASKSGNIYTLTQDVQLTTLDIDAGKTLETAGYKIKCSVSSNYDGSLLRVGNAGVGTTGGVAKSAGTLIGTTAGGAGATTGGSTGGNGGNTTHSLGGAGGAGGSASSCTLGSCAAGTAGTATAAITPMIYGVPAHTMFDFDPAGVQVYEGGAGGAGGEGASNGGQRSSSGAGGGGGGVIFLASLVVTVGAAGIISASGGAGGNGNNERADSPGGGGGGGGGGAVVIITHSYTNSGSVIADGGAAGAGPGTAGSVGGAGVVHVFELI